jgi:GTP-binding protein
MRARAASFLTSATGPAGFPADGPPEIAFAGRSNVGKSSLLNAVVGVAGLARTSATPGRTRLLNFFQVTAPFGDELRFVDLPGYGYAKVPREMRASWQPMIEAYVKARAGLRLLVVIIDARRGPEEEETELLEWLDELDRPALVVLTKSDKLPKNKRLPAAARARRDLGLGRAPILFSATDPVLLRAGAEELWNGIRTAVQSPERSR